MFLDIPPHSTAILIFEASVLFIINFVAFVGNFLVCLASFRNPQLRTTTNLYVIALAISDMLAASITMPLTFGALLKGRWIFGTVACNIQGFFVHFLIYASMHTMALTAVNRYFRIVKSHQYKKIFGGNRAAVFLVLVWMLVAIIVISPPLFGWARFEFHPGLSLYMCILYFQTKTGELSFLLTILVLYVTLSLIIMAISYVKVSRTIRNHNLQLAGTLRLNRRLSGVSVEEIHITKSLYTIVSTFAIGWIPVYAFISIIRTGLRKLSGEGSVIASFMIFLSSAVNPFIYAFRNKAFRKEFKNILLFWKTSRARVAPCNRLARCHTNSRAATGNKGFHELSFKQNIRDRAFDKIAS
ncbi:melatonin receptor type 1C-like [Actinia tenebrosa]|uniref:Melatonin receptor type 1C-like n=1 Tax=Actinia tenebrosa TaxID=6105 RepID=A0A6P8IVF8_ACTTE|nr:melatonin receptor type 1C-like [Actinia tenebrosa]